MKFLDFYKETLKNGKMKQRSSTVYGGLCGCMPIELIHSPEFFLLKPEYTLNYWADGEKPALAFHNCYNFTPLRQTTVLFCAAMRGEL